MHGQFFQKVKSRIEMGWSALGKQHIVMKDNLPLSLKKKVYNQFIKLILTYGSETWSPRKHGTKTSKKP